MPEDIEKDDVTSIEKARQRAIELVATDAFVSASCLLEALLSIRPNDGVLWFNLFEARRQMGQWSKAVDAFDKAAALMPENVLWTIQIRRAMLEADRGQPAETEHWYALAFTCDEVRKHRWPYVLRAANLCVLEQFDLAINHLKTALNVSSDRDEPSELDELYHTMGAAYLGKGDVAMALNYFKLAITVDSSSQTTARMLAGFDHLDEAIGLASVLKIPPR